jgi:hypothetical protein
VSDLLEISGMYRSVETPKFGVVRFGEGVKDRSDPIGFRFRVSLKLQSW